MSIIDHSANNGNHIVVAGWAALRPSVTDRIESFVPDMPERYWRIIGAFVREVVGDALPGTPYTADDLLSTVSRHVLWCWQTAGIKLERKAIFNRWIIEDFIVHGCPTLAPASRGNYRSRLFRVSEALLDPESVLVRLTPLPASDPVRPYSAAELEALRSWAAGQSTPTRRRDAATLLALGAGAGLAVEDMAELTAGMVLIDDVGVLVAVPGRRARLIPVLGEWEQPLVEAASSIRPECPLFREHRTTTNKNFVSNFVKNSSGVDIKPSVQRLRATWMVLHLAAGTPIVPLMHAAGVRSLEAFGRYVRFIPDVDPTEVREALRGNHRRGHSS